MKRRILLLICVGILGAAAYGHESAPEGNFMNFKVGITDGSLEFQGKKGNEYGDQDTSANISLHLEYIVSAPSGLEYGAGLGFLKGELNEHDKIRTVIENINTFPFYGLLRYRFHNNSHWEPYIFANLGYSYVDEEFISEVDGEQVAGDVEEGIYYAFGFGAEYQETYSAELIFSRTEANWDEWGGDDEKIHVDLITLAIGYRLGRR